ncbi:MAG: phosphodiester glycosidase family protein [Ignavibacteriaceae bacterium]|nr:phosphodiester glycosidase family protein [Ignavibacteriaceae bacterium]
MIMIKIRDYFFSLLLLTLYKSIFLLPFILFTAPSHSQVIIEERTISDGVIHKIIINQLDTLVINLLQIDIKNPDYSLITVKADNKLNAKETTSSMVEMLNDSGYQVIAALNADFFEADGEVVNNMISEGKIIKAVKFTDSPFNSFVNSQFALLGNGKLLIEQFVFSGLLILPGKTIIEIERVNSRTDSNSVTLYNSFQGKTTPIQPENWHVYERELIPTGKRLDTLLFIPGNVLNNPSEITIGNDGFILSSNNKMACYLEREFREADTVKVLLKFIPNYGNIISLVGGWPQLVKNGINLISADSTIEGIIPNFAFRRHPRTGIGFSEDSTKIYFITVDGRQQSSRGMTLVEFADLMIEEGIYHGLNLDGGGSTTMIIDGEVVNNPSDFIGERKVGNCIAVIRRKF